ncbi:MAG: PGF-CTERM sorting domain-containing protein [Candidatus Syntropharchaeales archaeon]
MKRSILKIGLMAIALMVVMAALPVSLADEQPERSLPVECIESGEVFTVGITSSGTGTVVETLCDGWVYVTTSLPADQVSVDGNTITFTLVGNPEFTYEVQAPDTEGANCTIEGVFTDIDQVDHPIGGDSEVTVCSAIASRDLPDECVEPGGEVQVTITSPGTGTITETICDGWTYVGSSIDLYDQEGNDLTFVLAGDTTFTYTLQAPDTEGASCDIVGIFRDVDNVDHAIGGESSVVVCAETATPSPTPTATSDGGNGDNDGTATPTTNETANATATPTANATTTATETTTATATLTEIPTTTATATETPTETPESTETPAQPGFGIALLLIGLAAAYLYRKNE